MRHDYEEYGPSHWGGCLYARHREKAGITQHEAILRSMWMRTEMEKRFSLSVITIHGLDNPYMAEHARLTLMADARRTELMCRYRRTGERRA